MWREGGGEGSPARGKRGFKGREGREEAVRKTERKERRELIVLSVNTRINSVPCKENGFPA